MRACLRSSHPITTAHERKAAALLWAASAVNSLRSVRRMRRGQRCLQGPLTLAASRRLYTATSTAAAAAADAGSAPSSSVPGAAALAPDDVVPHGAVAPPSSSPPLPPSPRSAAGDAVGRLSRLSVRRNATVDSVWETVPNWCALCSEPTNAWQHHVGKRDHLALEATLEAMVDVPRTWDPEEVWDGVEMFAMHYARRPPHGQPRPPAPHVRRLVSAGVAVPGVDHPLNIFYDSMDAGLAHGRRTELLGLLLHLQERGFLALTPQLVSYANAEGHNLLGEELMPLVAQLFPRAEVGQCAAMAATAVSSLCMETVYHLCGMEALITPELLAVFKGAGSGPTQVEEQADDADDRGGEEAVGEDDEPVALPLRCMMPRLVLGSLRWALYPHKVPPPPLLNRSDLKYEHYATLAATAARMVMTEIVQARVSECVTRLDPLLRTGRGRQLLEKRAVGAWRHHSLSATQKGGKGERAVEGRGSRLQQAWPAQLRRMIFQTRLPPTLSNSGMVEFTGGLGLSAAAVDGTPSAEGLLARHDAEHAAKQRKRQQLSSKERQSQRFSARAVRTL